MVNVKKILMLASVSFMAIGCAANAGNGVAYQDDTAKADTKGEKRTKGLWINGNGGHGERWSDIDTDGDDLISLEEWRARENYEDDDFFDRFDMNDDDKVSRDEIEEYVEKTVEEAMQGLDIKLHKMRHMNKVVKVEELKALEKAELARVDVERIREKAERVVERAERIKARIANEVLVELEDGMKGNYAFTFDFDEDTDFMAGFGMLHRDLDEDGVVSKEEYLKSVEEEFAKFDTNGDGKIDDQDDRKGTWGYKFKKKEKRGDKDGDKE